MILTVLMRLASFSYQKALVIGLIFGAFFYRSCYDDGSRIQTQIGKIQEEIQAEEAKSKDAAAALAEVEQVRTTVGALSEQFKTVSEKLPSVIQMSEIIRTVDLTAKASGVLIKSKEPLPAVDKVYYEEVPLRISMEGTYSELTLFLFYLASYKRIMKVKNFVISQPPKSDGGGSRRLSLNGDVVSYRFIASAVSTDATAGGSKQ